MNEVEAGPHVDSTGSLAIRVLCVDPQLNSAYFMARLFRRDFSFNKSIAQVTSDLKATKKRCRLHSDSIGRTMLLLLLLLLVMRSAGVSKFG